MSELMIALHALILIDNGEILVTSEDLAKNINVNRVRVREVFSKLSRYGFITTINGRKGGYKLNKKLKDISIKDVVEAINFEFIATNWTIGDKNSNCPISSNMDKYMKELFFNLNDKLGVIIANISLESIKNSLIKDKGKCNLDKITIK